MYEPTDTYELIQGLKCYIPNKPDIINGQNLPIKEQKWIRPIMPEEIEEWYEEESHNLKHDPDYVHPKLEALKAREWERRLNGYWFMKKGKPFYITGLHYFYLTHYEMPDGYPEYRDTDRRWFYFWDYCAKDPLCYGDIEATMRRNGKSFRAGCMILERMTKPPHKKLAGIQSKSKEDAASFFSKTVVDPFSSLPLFFQPETATGTNERSRMYFAAKSVRKAGAKAKFRKENELRNQITYGSDVDGHYDGAELFTSVDDEAGKLIKGNIVERWKVKQKCLWKEGRIVGKEHMTTTVEEQGGKEFQMLWNDSNQYNRKSNGATKSGLYRYFLSALEGTFFDQYGDPVIETDDLETQNYLANKYGENARYGAKKYYEMEMEGLKGSDLASFKRKHPFTEGDMFSFGDDNSPFNTYILGNRLTELKLHEPCRRGDLVYESGTDSNVYFVSNPLGKWKISENVDLDKVNKVIQIGLFQNAKGEFIPKYRPCNDAYFRAGQDPVDAGKEVQGQMSDTALYVKRLYDHSIDHELETYNERTCDGHDYKIGLPIYKTNIPVCQYIAREDDPLVSFEDTIKTIRFFGCSILIESNKKSLLNYLKDRGYEEFCMYRPRETFTSQGNNQNQMGIFQSDPIIQQWTTLLKSDVTNYGHMYPFIELVEDLLEYRRVNIREHDCTVAWGHTNLATLGEAKVEITEQIDLSTIIPTYKNGQRV